MKNRNIQGDALEVLKTLPDESIDMCITSPPYWALRDYGVEGQLGLELTFKEYINKLCGVFDEVKRVLKKEGTCWVNMGDTYGTKSGGMEQLRKMGKDTPQYGRVPYKFAGVSQKGKEIVGMDKCLLQIPSRFAIEMTNRGWILRNEIIWHKPNCMPSSVKDRFTVDFEKLFFFSKNKKYYFETQTEESKGEWNSAKSFNEEGQRKRQGSKSTYGKDLEQTGRNKRTVWKITTKPFKEAHFAVYPPELIETPIKAGCPENGIILDPFIGSGTTAVVAKQLDRNYIGIELNPEYIKIIEDRLKQPKLL